MEASVKTKSKARDLVKYVHVAQVIPISESTIYSARGRYPWLKNICGTLLVDVQMICSFYQLRRQPMVVKDIKAQVALIRRAGLAVRQL